MEYHEPSNLGHFSVARLLQAIFLLKIEKKKRKFIGALTFYVKYLLQSFFFSCLIYFIFKFCIIKFFSNLCFDIILELGEFKDFIYYHVKVVKKSIVYIIYSVKGGETNTIVSSWQGAIIYSILAIIDELINH